MEHEVNDRHKPPLSPCVLICTLDDDNICLGCGRSLQQISGWARMNSAEQWGVIDELDARGSINRDTLDPTAGTGDEG